MGHMGHETNALLVWYLSGLRCSELAQRWLAPQISHLRWLICEWIRVVMLVTVRPKYLAVVQLSTGWHFDTSNVVVRQGSTSYWQSAEYVLVIQWMVWHFTLVDLIWAACTKVNHLELLWITKQFLLSGKQTQQCETVFGKTDIELKKQTVGFACHFSDTPRKPLSPNVPATH